MTGRNIFKELLATWPGKLGLGLFAVLVILSLYVLIRFPLSWGAETWSDPAVWADNPTAVPPVWSVALTTRADAPHRDYVVSEPTEVRPTQSGELHTYAATVDYDSDRPPTFTNFSVAGITFHDRPPVLTLSLVRPDDSTVVLFRQPVRGPREDETAPYLRYHEDALRVNLSSQPSAADAVADFLRDEYGATFRGAELAQDLDRALFGVPDPEAPNGFAVVKGTYELRLRASFQDPRDSLEEARFVVGGTVFGLMGTDSLGRDLTEGLLFGLPVALFIGLMASVVTTAVGTSLGVISGYAGGRTDLFIQRLADLVANVPLLPLLIFFVFVVGSNLYLIIGLLIIFSWPGLTILVRSMVLQLREGQLVESAITMGASRWRIMYRHIFPQIAPYVFAQMIFFAPAAILAEAGLSFLGLGDPSIPTWGQILESGFRTGAAFLGYWWWIIPPGALIIITAVTFMLISLGMEPVVNPRLRRGR